MRPFWRRRPRYRIVIVGLESGNRSPIDFLVFKHESDAQLWCDHAHEREELPDGLIRWTYEEI